MGTNLGVSNSLLDFRATTDRASLDLLAHAAVEALPGIGTRSACAVSFLRPGQAFLTAGTSESATGLARRDLEMGAGPVSHALRGQPSLILNGYSACPQWPAYWRHLADAGYRSLVSVPLALGPVGPSALTLVSANDDVFTPQALARLTAFCDVASNSFLMATEVRTAQATADQLRSALKGRTSIDVACGVIMGQNRCSYQDAFQIIARASSHRNVKARVVAETILKDLPGGSPPTHFTA